MQFCQILSTFHPGEGCTNLRHHRQCMRVLLSQQSHQQNSLSYFKRFSGPIGENCFSSIVLICISLIMCEVELLRMCLRIILISFTMNYMFMSLSHFSLWFLVLCPQFLRILCSLALVCGIYCNYFLPVCQLSSDFVVFCHAIQFSFYVVRFINLLFIAPRFGVTKSFLTPKLKKNSPVFSSVACSVSFFYIQILGPLQFIIRIQLYFFFQIITYLSLHYLFKSLS